MSAVRQNGTCIRCSGRFGTSSKCSNCGVHVNRVVKRIRRRGKIGGKRGHNSGKVSNHGKKQ